MKEALDAIWNMPAPELLRMILLVIGAVFLLKLSIVALFWWRFNRARKRMHARQEEFRRKHGFR